MSRGLSSAESGGLSAGLRVEGPLGARKRAFVAGTYELADRVRGVDEGVGGRRRHVAVERVGSLGALAEAFEGVPSRSTPGRRSVACNGDYPLRPVVVGCRLTAAVGRSGERFDFLEKRQGVGAVRLNRADGRHSAGLSERSRNAIGGRPLPVVGAGQEREDVLAVGVDGVSQPVETVDRLEQLAGGEVRLVECREPAGVDEPSSPAVLSEVVSEGVDSGPRERAGGVAEPVAVRRQVQIDGRVRVHGAVVDADAPETAAARTRDRPRLVVRPPRPARSTLAFAPNSHRSTVRRVGPKRLGSRGSTASLSASRSFLLRSRMGRSMGLDDDAREYHREEPPGKIAIETTKPTNTQRDLSLAYSPGVAAPCRDIAADPDSVFEYTAKGNLVAVVSNGSAVLGLGDIGATASKPVMEGKGVLFKRFADIDVFDIELDIDAVEPFCETVQAMEPTFGGVNLEDIKAPECFEIESRLREEMDVPVFHDDQHGTAIISGAALMNAVDISEKELSEIEIVFSGAGASAIATARFYVSLGARKENITMCDSSGIITEARAASGDVNEYKSEFAKNTGGGDLADAMAGADVFVGLSVGGIVSPEMVRSMAANPILFAMANPDPEITYADAKNARDDTVIMATGRSDYPNMVNNVLGFPFLFRGALDVRATEINEEMKAAAAEALAELARQDVPDAVVKAYGDDPLQFGPDYVIPKPLDPRVLFEVAPRVAEAAIESGCARTDIDLQRYRERLEARLGKSREMMRVVLNKAKSDPKRIALAEGTDGKMIRAAHQLSEQGIAEPVLLGDEDTIARTVSELGLSFRPEVVDPNDRDVSAYGEQLHELRKRKGVTRGEADQLVSRDTNYLASAMVKAGDVDAMLTGLTHHYPSALRPPLEVVGSAAETDTVAGVYMLTFRDRVVFCADTTVTQDPDAETLAEITRHTATLARRFNVEPRAAVLSYSDFGSVDNERTRTPRDAVEILHGDDGVDFPVDGEMQADTAVVDDILNGTYEFSELDEAANVLVFPNLEAGNIGYKLLQRLGGAEATGPMLVGMDKPVHVLQRDDEVKDIVNLASVAVVDAQE